MAYVMNVIFKATDEISPTLNNISNAGSRVIAGLEDEFVKINSAINQTVKDSSEYSGFLTDESEELRKNAQTLQLKADSAERAAESARRYYEEIQKEIEIGENASDSLKKNAASALREAETLEKSANAWRKEADNAEQSYSTANNNIHVTKNAIQAEEKFADSLNKATQMEQKAAISISELSGNTSSTVTTTRLLANELAKEAERLAQSAKSARDAADEKKRIAQNAKEFHEDLKKQIEESDNVSDSLAAQAEQARKTAKTYEDIAKRAEKRAQSMEETAVAARNNASAVEKAAQADEQLYNSAAKTVNIEQKVADSLNKSEQEAKEYGEAAEKAAVQSKELGDSGTNAISEFESLITGAGIVMSLKKIGQEFLNCSNAAAGFESGIAKISTIADTSQVSLGTIRSDIVALSKDTGQSVSDLSEAAYQAISASVDTANAVAFVDEANMLAVGGFTQQATAADVLTTAINAYGLAVSDATEVSDMLITTQNLGKTTVDELAQNMGRVIPLAAAYNVEMDNLSAAYATMTKNGIATAESTTYVKSMLNELGDTGSTVAGVLEKQTGQSFANLMDSGYSLADVLTVIGDSVDGDTTAFNNLWGSQEAGIGALSLFNAGAEAFNKTLTDMQKSAGATERAYTTMTNTTEAAQQRMSNAFSNLKITIGEQLNPTMKELYNTGENAINMFSEFISENPAITAAVTSTVTVLGIGTVALTGYTIATKSATVATKAFNLATTHGKILAIITGITAAVGAFKTFTSVMDGNKETVEDYNGTLEQCHTEIEETEAAYANVCKMYGEESQAAQNLASELDMLNAQYQKGGGYTEEMNQKVEELSDSYNSLQTEINNTYDSISESEQNGLVAIAQLEAFSQKAELTNSDLDLMSNYADYLNDTFNCNIKVNYDTEEITGFNPEALTSEVIDNAERQKIQVSVDYLSDFDFQSNYRNAYKSYKEAVQKLAPLKSQYDTLTKPNSSGSGQLGSAQDLEKLAKEFGGSVEDMETAFSELDELESEYLKWDSCLKSHADVVDETGIFYESLKDSLQKVAMTSAETADSAEEMNKALSPEEAVSDIWAANEQEILQFAKAYDEAYGSIRTSLDSMFGLFEEAKMNLENTLSLDGAVKSFESQFEYFSQYEEALNSLSEIGIDNNIIEQLNPEQAVAFAEELGKMDSETAAVKVDELNGAFDKLSEVKDKTATAMAGVDEELSEKLKEIQSNMDKSLENMVDSMELSDEMADAAESTMNGYLEQMISSGESAVLEAENIAARIFAAFSSVSATRAEFAISGATGLIENAYATGTLSAEPGIALVGEEGPELINFRGGEAVYTTDETEKILNGFAERSLYVPPVKSFSAEKFDANPETVSKKEISLDITGKGSVNIQSNMSKEQVVSILSDYIKPVLMGIVEQEIFEEGEGSYEF